MVADGMTVEEILADFPYLEPDDITEALRYAAEAVRERELPLRPWMRFLVDASMSPVVVQELRLAGHNAVHVGEVLRLDAPDEDILEHAARDARVIVAADTDFGELLAARQVAQRRSCCSTGRPVGGHGNRRRCCSPTWRRSSRTVRGLAAGGCLIRA
jgi:hypothetical protein